MINSLFAHNFKSWKDTGKVRLAPITGLFGSNSSGKTSLLQLLLMFKQTVESSDRALVLNLGDGRSLVELGTYKDILFEHGAETSMSFGLSLSLGKALEIKDPEDRKKILLQGDMLDFKTVLDENGSGRISVHDFSYQLGKHSFGMKRKKGNTYSLDSSMELKRTPGRPWDLPAPVKCYGFPDQARAYYQRGAFLPELELAVEQFFSHVYYLGPLREYPKRQYTWAGAQPSDMGWRGEQAVDALLASRDRHDLISRGRGHERLTVEQYVAWWLRKLELIHDFSVEPVKEGSNLYQVKVKKTKGGSEVLITDVGFGVSQILPVLAICYYVPEGSTIIMEQPEIHLHPAVQAGLADVFIDAVKTRNVQIIVESHSEHLLKRFQRHIAEETFAADQTALYFCEMRDGRSHLRHLDVNLYGEISNWPEYFFGDDFGEIAAIAKAKARRQKREPPR